jgi:hypothetical protein
MALLASDAGCTRNFCSPARSYRASQAPSETRMPLPHSHIAASEETWDFDHSFRPVAFSATTSRF